MHFQDEYSLQLKKKEFLSFMKQNKVDSYIFYSVFFYKSNPARWICPSGNKKKNVIITIKSGTAYNIFIFTIQK